MIVFLDLDGVLVNLDAAVIKLFNLNEKEVMANWQAGVWEISTGLGMESEDMWSLIAKQPPSFWADAPAYPWAEELYHTCREFGDTFFLTAPISAPDCASGKMAWMSKFTGDSKFRRFIIGKEKWLCAGSDRVLIDDKKSNVESFSKFGGHGVLFPRWQNELHQHSKDPVAYVRKKLELAAASQGAKQ